MRSFLILLASSGTLAFALWRLERALEAHREDAGPLVYPVRRRRSDGPSTLFLDAPAFRRRLQAGWGADDRNRLLR